MNWKKITLAAFIFLSIGSLLYFDLNRFFDLDFIKSQLDAIQSYKQENFELTLLIYFCVYCISVALSIPGAMVLTLLGGAVFGVFFGTLVISFASSIGATLAFFISRIFLRNWAIWRARALYIDPALGRVVGPVGRALWGNAKVIKCVLGFRLRPQGSTER